LFFQITFNQRFVGYTNLRKIARLFSGLYILERRSLCPVFGRSSFPQIFIGPFKEVLALVVGYRFIDILFHNGPRNSATADIGNTTGADIRLSILQDE
jgi:hypothetical protein